MDGDRESDTSWDSSSDYSSGDSGRPMRREDFWAACLFFSLCGSVVFGLLSIPELRYAVAGETTVAQVKEAKTVAASPGQAQRSEMLSVTYSFPIQGGPFETASDLLPGDWPRPGSTIDVQFIPGERIKSRVAGHGDGTTVYLFFGSLVVLAGTVFKFYREAKASERRPRRRYD